MNLFEQYKDYIRRNNLFTMKDKLLLAVSGGVDSVVLCELCKQGGYDFAIAHCNFQLRDEESERDEKFVTELAVKYNAGFHVTRFDTKKTAKERKLSTQEAARDLRYEWFEEIREKSGYNYILTAHHADDNIETVLMNFFRGTGIKGISGIEPKQGVIVRPLLFARRKELERFLAENKLEFVSDRSNQEDDYTRNFFRNQVIPMIEKIFPGSQDNLLSNISRFSEVGELYRQAVDLHRKKLLENKGNEVHIPVLKLKKIIPLRSVLYEILRDYDFTAPQVPDVIALLDSDTGKYVSSSTHRVIRNRQWLIIAPMLPGRAETILIEEGEKNVQCSIFNVQFSIEDFSGFIPPTSNSMACLDAYEIKFPLLLRKWKPGDYFYPLGMRKKKKLSRFFIDQKLSKTEKENAWVLEMDKKIIWVVGYRIDERFKITDKTKAVLKIKSSPLAV